MFELPGLPVLDDLTDTALIDVLEHRTRTEAMVASQRLAVIGEVWARFCEDEDGASAHCVIDGWESAAAAVSAACHLTRAAASSQMSIAGALRERLPKVAAVFARGEISAKVVATITWRTKLITDDEAVALVDTALAGSAATYGTLSQEKAEQAIDVWVEKFDPAAVRRTRTAARGRDVEFGSPDDPSGMVTIWGRLLATDAALLAKLLNTMAREVCEDDPRSMGQRRADALGAIAAGADRLTCQCGSPTCDATGVDPRSRAVVVHLLAHLRPQWATTPGNRGDGTPDDSGYDCAENDSTTADADDRDGADADGPEVDDAIVEDGQLALAHPSGLPRDPRIHGTPTIADLGNDAVPTLYGGPAIILGGGIVPAPLLAELIATGAKIDHLTHPHNIATPDRYRPSAKLATFVRMRDLRCVFPGCGVSATCCDLDHTVPWPQGVTHPGNLGPKCRNHHLLKTFRTGEDGWTDVQHPDGSHTWTAPTGHTYRTTPFSRILFPDWNPHTPAPPLKPVPPTTVNRDMKMPQRNRTRQQTRTQRINTERRHNAEHDKPPPF